MKTRSGIKALAELARERVHECPERQGVWNVVEVYYTTGHITCWWLGLGSANYQQCVQIEFCPFCGVKLDENETKAN